VGIGIGIGVLALVVAGIIGWVLYRQRRKIQTLPSGKTPPENTETPQRDEAHQPVEPSEMESSQEFKEGGLVAELPATLR
jgi:uncharacterized iron-regulated membrane protein